ncbi:Dot/Icm T4SS effector CpeF [Coxiella burnetii]|uniref:Uncharacterized protein n=2 Tax=Coxiella burnetii TaxID=777 RepID=O52877_COXBE|nr:Dot/Icm T4SS effector CpeF [Coxiella burnetii]ACJ21254.1 hypothetical protein CbuK_A0021 [Coxiella burnetii CbuK_Q154]EAX32540.1 hypothetical protein A35_0035 [Coxiella burnetii 'MSU Goat Q177']UYK70728.1 Dot/Icm T4SS effector CpeF [Coxiella burnetii]CAA75835.1 hypothetical protein [Coxiella burnetii]
MKDYVKEIDFQSIKNSNCAIEETLQEWLRGANSVEKAHIFIVSPENQSFPICSNQVSSANLFKLKIHDIKSVIINQFKVFGLKSELIINYILTYGGIDGYSSVGEACLFKFDSLMGVEIQPRNHKKTYVIHSENTVNYIEAFNLISLKERRVIGHFSAVSEIKLSENGEIIHVCKEANLKMFKVKSKSQVLVETIRKNLFEFLKSFYQRICSLFNEQKNLRNRNTKIRGPGIG